MNEMIEVEQNFRELLYQKCEKIGVLLNDLQIRQFYDYYLFLIEKNKVMNLTAITEMDDVIKKHFVDSLSVSKFLNINTLNKKKLLDLGSGAGMPGLPLKIAFPDLSVTLVDSLLKRIRFLDETCAMLKLQDVSTVHGRAEELGKDGRYREKFDFCVSRAVANLSVLTEYCLPFVKTGGLFISYKSIRVSEELPEAARAIRLLGGEITDKRTFLLDDQDERSLIFIKKIKETPKKYPRRSGIPLKQPL